jgi:protein gp37
MSDLFQPGVPDAYIEAVCRVMVTAKWHTFQVLTKRSERLQQLLSGRLRFAAEQDHIWWGVSVEDRQYGLPRIADLQKTPARVRFLSIEPLLEDLGSFDLSKISWTIVGGESGPRARPMHEDWVISVRDQCREADVPFFFKQWGGVRKKKNGRVLEGRTYNEYPARVASPIPEHANCLAYAQDIVSSLQKILSGNSLAQVTA